jgi:hypothetical protein
MRRESGVPVAAIVAIFTSLPRGSSFMPGPKSWPDALKTPVHVKLTDCPPSTSVTMHMPNVILSREN